MELFDLGRLFALTSNIGIRPVKVLFVYRTQNEWELIDKIVLSLKSLSNHIKRVVDAFVALLTVAAKRKVVQHELFKVAQGSVLLRREALIRRIAMHEAHARLTTPCIVTAKTGKATDVRRFQILDTHTKTINR